MITIPGEILTAIFGGALGLVCAVINGHWRRRAIWLVASVLGGTLISALNAEFPHSPEFLLFDVPMVAGIALLTTCVLRWLRTRIARPQKSLDGGGLARPLAE